MESNFGLFSSSPGCVVKCQMQNFSSLNNWQNVPNMVHFEHETDFERKFLQI